MNSAPLECHIYFQWLLPLFLCFLTYGGCIKVLAHMPPNTFFLQKILYTKYLTAFSLICFAFAQQKIYNTSAGLVDTYDHILVTYSITIIYGCMYIVFLTSGNQFIDKIIIFTATIAFCLFIWFFAISKDVKKIDSSQEKSINRITGKQ